MSSPSLLSQRKLHATDNERTMPNHLLGLLTHPPGVLRQIDCWIMLTQR